MSTPTETGRGFFPLPRELIFNKSNLLNNDERIAFLYMCQEAAWRDHPRKIQNAIEIEKRGTLIVGRRYMADKVCMPLTTLNRFLERLEADGEITLSCTRRGTTVIAILAYDVLFCNGSSRIEPDQAEDVACGDADMEAISKRSAASEHLADPIQSERDSAHRGSTQTNSYTPNRIQKDPPDLSPGKPAAAPIEDGSIVCEMKQEPAMAAPAELAQPQQGDQAPAKPTKSATRKAGQASEDVVLEAVDAWNDMANANGMNPAPAMTPSRKGIIRSRVREAGGIEGWCAVIGSFPTSWLAKNDRTWLEDILAERTFTKLREGFYHREIKLAERKKRGDASWMAPWLNPKPKANASARTTIDVDGNLSETPVRFDGMGDLHSPIIDPHAEMQLREDERRHMAGLEEAYRSAQNENYTSATYGSPDKKAAAKAAIATAAAAYSAALRAAAGDGMPV
jgi:hypothetical protein